MAWMAYVVYSQDLVELPSDLTFSCEGRSYGYYADPTTNCQVFHICLGDGDIKWSFLCPNQTIFNQVRNIFVKLTSNHMKIQLNDMMSNIFYNEAIYIHRFKNLYFTKYIDKLSLPIDVPNCFCINCYN